MSENTSSSTKCKSSLEKKEVPVIKEIVPVRFDSLPTKLRIASAPFLTREKEIMESEEKSKTDKEENKSKSKDVVSDNPESLTTKVSNEPEQESCNEVSSKEEKDKENVTESESKDQSEMENENKSSCPTEKSESDKEENILDETDFTPKRDDLVATIKKLECRVNTNENESSEKEIVSSDEAEVDTSREDEVQSEEDTRRENTLTEDEPANSSSEISVEASTENGKEEGESDKLYERISEESNECEEEKGINEELDEKMEEDKAESIEGSSEEASQVEKDGNDEFIFPSIEISDVRTVQELESESSKQDEVCETDEMDQETTNRKNEKRNLEEEDETEQEPKKRRNETDAEIKNFAMETMNELLGLFGYDKMEENDQTKPDSISNENKITENSDNINSDLNSTKEEEVVEEKITKNGPKENKDDKSKIESASIGTSQACAECRKIENCKYQVLMQESTCYLCGDECFKMFRYRQRTTVKPIPKNVSTTVPTNSVSGLVPILPRPPTTLPENRPITRSLTTPKDYCNICHKEIKNGLGLLPGVGETKPLCSEECMKKYQITHAPKRACSQCGSVIQGRNKCLTWETMEFCNEDCLGKYQTYLGSHCACCNTSVQRTSLGKYCVRFGSDIKQFCSNSCLDEFKSRLKVCSFCQKDISGGREGFLAPVGDKGLFKVKDFCSRMCLDKYEAMNRKSNSEPTFHHCSVCNKLGPINVQVSFDGDTHKLCSEQCIAAFRYANKINTSICDTCHRFFDVDASQPHTIQIEGLTKRFCTKTCMNVFVLSNRKIVPCTWCKVKKYNFDMIERVDSNNHVQLFCSLNCLSLFRVSLNATSSKSVRCDYCQQSRPAQYHLTMSDASIRNFCSYQCVMNFQSQFTSVTPVTATSTKVTTTTTSKNAAVSTTSEGTGTPVISSVVSLAPTTQAPKIVVPARQQNGTSIIAPVLTSTSTTTKSTSTSNVGQQTITQIAQQVLIKPPPPKQFKNKSLLCRPFMQTKGVSCKPHPCHKAIQTDPDETPGKPILIPVPVPVYVPMPMHMYVNPVPVPIPFPLPVPVPVFIPTSKATVEELSQQMKEIQEKIPSNPFEAELLMMAEMVANNNKSANNNSNANTNGGKSNAESSPSPGHVASSTTSGTSNGDQAQGSDVEQVEQYGMENQISDGIHASNAFSDDMLQMALRMATEMDEPAMDIESALGSGSNQSAHDTAFNNIEENNSDVLSPRELRARNRSQKRTGGSSKGRGRKKSRMDENSLQMTPTGFVTPADNNSVLKYTYGVNAWKHWVLQKNTQLEKASQSNRKLKLFKTDLLQLTADELNYSLCLFVKEVRKPNREEYASDSIFYLCLGIQQYLFENGRIDNIFTDAYYEKFTECLNEVLQKAESGVGTEGVFTSRIEEEILWEAKQLGAHSPHVLLNTLMYFNTKFFMLRTVEDHMKLSFSHVMKHWKKSLGSSSVTNSRSSSSSSTTPGSTSRNVLLKYCPPPSRGEVGRKRKDDQPSFEQLENLDNPLRCPVKLYEFYLSKCPESIKNRSDVFYLYPERSCVPDSPVWYSTMALGKEAVAKMLQRIKTVREVCQVF